MVGFSRGLAVVVAAGVAVAGLGVARPAEAYWFGYYGFRPRVIVAPYGYYAPYYRPPVYYAPPPPVYYAPPVYTPSYVPEPVVRRPVRRVRVVRRPATAAPCNCGPFSGPGQAGGVMPVSGAAGVAPVAPRSAAPTAAPTAAPAPVLGAGAPPPINVFPTNGGARPFSGD